MDTNIDLGDVKSRSADVFGHVFEYFLGEFAAQLKEEAELNERIKQQLNKIQIPDG